MPVPKGLDAEAKKMWRRVVKDLKPKGLITPSDAIALEMLCRAFASWRAAAQEVQDQGANLVSLTPNGYEAASPWVAIERTEYDKLYKMLKEFALTPVRRGRVTPAEGTDDDPMTGLLD